MLFASTIHHTYHTVATPHWVTIHDILSEYSKTRPSFPDTSSIIQVQNCSHHDFVWVRIMILFAARANSTNSLWEAGS